MPEQTILVVEDNHKTRTLVRQYLERAGYTVREAADGRTALARARETAIDLVVLDLMLPEIDGLTVCRALRRELGLPIIMVTARSTEDDRIHGLDLGADDYMIKPFSPRELVARVAAVLRRVRSDRRRPERIAAGDVVIDTRRRAVEVSGRAVAMTPTELRLLACLVASPGRTFSRDELIDDALGHAFAGRPRTIDAHMRNVRRKIDSGSDRRSRIESVYGQGYRFRAMP